MVFIKYFFQTSSFCLCNHTLRRACSSALYVTGDKATGTFSVLTPHLDFDERFKDIEGLKKNVKHRGIALNVEKLKGTWDFMKDIQSTKNQLEKRKVEVANKMKVLRASTGKGKSIENEAKLRIEGKMIRDDLKAVMKNLWELEENAIIRALALPNDLHALTPVGEDKLVHEFGSRTLDITSESHLEKGTAMNLIKYCNQVNYYLLEEAAYFELGGLDFFSEKLSQFGYVRFSNADFARSVVVEGVGIKHKNPMETIILKSDEVASDDDRLHLVGGASLASFACFHSKQIIHPKSLPLRYYTSGRQYNPKQKIDGTGLLNVWQSSAVEIFIATTDDHNVMMQEFSSLLSQLISVYECLGMHFRVVYVQASSLQPWESLRASFQLFSSHSQSYIEVGHVSLSDDYVSKRLLMSFQESDKAERHFVKIVSATAVVIPRLLACILEQTNEHQLCIPDQIKQHMLNVD